MTSLLKSLLAHPLTRSLDLDDPKTTVIRRKIIQSKPFLRKIYLEWYSQIMANSSSATGSILELGSGGGFLEQLIPGLMTTDVFFCPGIDVELDGQMLPFDKQALGAIVLLNVLHHMPKAPLFFEEAARCVRPDGIIVMLEPWVTSWSRVVYSHLHHEPFNTETPSWEFPSSGPLSGANGALPWIIFERDRKQFEARFPQWQIQSIKPIMPLTYLVSGGIALRSLMPGFTFELWQFIERMLEPWADRLAMFALIVLRRQGQALSTAG